MDDPSRMFDAPADTHDDIASAPGRGGRRDSMFLTATIHANGAAAALRVRNISSGGLMAECPLAVRQGDGVQIELRGIGPVGARIAWVRGGRIGVRFATTIDPQLARRAEPRSPGAGMELVRGITQQSRRPPLKIK